jgi:hypothetical protein
MKRLTTAALALLLILATTVIPAVGSANSIYYFSVSLVNPRTRALTPLKVYYNGHLTVDRRMNIPHGATFYVKLIAPRGKYVSAVFRDDTDTLYDLPYRARLLTSDTKEFLWTMPRRFVPGNVEFYACLYSSYNPEMRTMGDALDRTGWMELGKTDL